MMQLHWNVEGMLSTLPIMLKGMVGIFAVILVIWLFIALLGRLTKGKE